MVVIHTLTNASKASANRIANELTILGFNSCIKRNNDSMFHLDLVMNLPDNMKPEDFISLGSLIGTMQRP